ncbi:craniofacial development protein 2-like [Plutella xylostella]|uniref:craniofacial development protein 2-like n=1 Tax=Plutella xylostella TaxID=51655 RepID=UPI0020328412|nr:craniofacial development protein 2-like [Plutella xylostella]
MGSTQLNQPEGGDEARHPSRRISRGGEKWFAEARLGTFNVCGGMEDKVDEVYEMMEARGIDILCVNETKRKGNDITTHGSYTAYWSGVDVTERACQGVGIILSERMVNCVKGYECVSPLLGMRLKVGLRKLFVLGVYAPDMSKNISIREEFWESVRETLMICEDNEYVIMLGDFNGRVGVKRTGYESVLGTFGDVSVNENGESLLEVCMEKKLIVTNTLFCHKKIHMYTWQRGKDRSMIDFAIVDGRMKSEVVDTRVFRGNSVGTDHYMVICRISGLFKGWRHRAPVSTTPLQRIRVENLRDECVKEKYLCNLKEKFSDMSAENKEEKDFEYVWDRMKRGLVDAATEVCGISKKKNDRKRNRYLLVG